MLESLKRLFARPAGARDAPGRVLNVGGGSKGVALPPHFDSWQQRLLDIDPRTGADLVCDARALRERVDANAFDAVYCSHNLEHYYRHEVDQVLRGFLHVLKADGFAEIRVADIGELVRLLAQDNLDLEQEIYQSAAGPITAHDMIYGDAAQIADSGKDFYAHKTGFSADSLERALRANGFGEIYFAPPLSAFELHAFAFKTKAGTRLRTTLGLVEAATTRERRDISPPPGAASAGADPVETLYQRAAAAYRASAWPLAAELARQAAAAEPGLAAPHYLLGRALFDMGEFAAAQAEHEACAGCKPAYPLLLEAQLRAAQAWARAGLAAGRKPHTARLDARGRSVSVVICSVRPERFARARASYAERFAAVEHEIIGIHDARSLCEGYNRGMRRARGDVLVFSHDDIELASPDFAARLLLHLEHYDVVGIAGATSAVAGVWLQAGWPHIHGQVGMPGSAPGSVIVTGYPMRGSATPGAQLLDGVLIAARREAALRTGWDEATFDGWHFYDLDFSYAAARSGLRVAIAHDLLVVHDSSGRFGEEWQRYCEKFRDKYRDTLPREAPAAPPELCSVEAAGHDEWRLMTEYLTRDGG